MYKLDVQIDYNFDQDSSKEPSLKANYETNKVNSVVKFVFILMNVLSVNLYEKIRCFLAGFSCMSLKLLMKQ